MIEDRRADGNLRENVVHIEVPFGKPIEEVYDGIQSGMVLGSGISGTVRLVTHKATGIKYAVKVLDLSLIGGGEGLQQLREEIFIMCQVRDVTPKNNSMMIILSNSHQKHSHCDSRLNSPSYIVTVGSSEHRTIRRGI